MFLSLRRYSPGLWTAVLYGGGSIKPQLEQLAHAPDVVIATPGRLLTCHRAGLLDLSHVRTVVLDEVGLRCKLTHGLKAHPVFKL